MAYEREHTVEDADDSTLLTELREEERQKLNLKKIREMTVGENLMKLPVSYVTTADNSPQWSITVEHPIEGELTFYVDSPVNGWIPKRGNIVQVLNWYGIKTEDPYQLQVMSIYVKKTNSSESRAHGWELAEPPEYDDPIGIQLRKKWNWLKGSITIPSLKYITGWFILFLTNIATAGIIGYENYDVTESMLVSVIYFAGMSVILLMILEDA